MKIAFWIGLIILLNCSRSLDAVSTANNFSFSNSSPIHEDIIHFAASSPNATVTSGCAAPISPPFSWAMFVVMVLLLWSILVVEDDSVCPTEISGLVGQEFLFKVEVKDQPSEVFEPNYRVKRLTNDGEIIKQFRSINVINEAGNFGASVTVTDLPTQDPDTGDQAKDPLADLNTPPLDQAKDPLADLNTPPLDASCDLGDDGGIAKVIPVSLGSSSTTASYSSPKNGSGKNKNMATPSKKMSIAVDESAKASCSPKLLRTIKIEKP